MAKKKIKTKKKTIKKANKGPFDGFKGFHPNPYGRYFCLGDDRQTDYLNS